MKSRFMLGLGLGLAIGTAACSDADVAGNYTAKITNRGDGCSIGLTSGEETTADVTVLQSGSDVTLRVQGLASVLVATLVGSAQFEGSVDGDSVDLSISGTVPWTSGNCEYTYNATLEASLDGDTLSGRVEYRTATNGGSDCGTRQDCVSRQDFNAVRAPQ